MYRFASLAKQGPDLCLTVIPGGEEGEVFAVRTPAGVRGRFSLSSHRDRITALGRNHPHPAAGLVFLKNTAIDYIGNPIAFRADLRIADAGQFKIMLNGQTTGFSARLSGPDGLAKHQDHNGDRNEKKLEHDSHLEWSPLNST